MDFRILGPLEVVSDGRPLDIGAHKQRALLAMLLIEANRVVSSDRLIDALWDDAPPETAQKALQVYVSQLRKLLGRERVETQTPGYLVHVGPDELDLARFQRLRAEGRLREALAVWRGAPLPEFAYHRFARAEVARLEELRFACLEECVAGELQRGGHHDVVAELEGLVAEQPLREGLRAQLMLALYRSGRQAEALETYQASRATLVEELGIEPGRELRELHQRILEQDPALDLATEPPQAPSQPQPQPAEPAARDERKTVTAVFVALGVSSASGGEIDPEALRYVTGRVVGEVEAAVRRHGGSVEAVAGEAVTAVFGLPRVHEDDALRAVRAAGDVRDALAPVSAEVVAERGLALSFRIGISTGGVVTGGDGSSRLRATGEPLTRSARLAHAAQDGETVLDDATSRLVRARERRLVSPMVGRERECRRLRDAFDQAVGDRSCQLFTVLGLAGVGKSRLVREFLDGVEGQASVARGRCLPYGEGITFWPLLEAVKDAVGLADTDSPDECRAKLTAALPAEDDADLIAQQVTALIGLAETDGPAGEDPFTIVRALFEGLARPRPFVLVFDDIHWAEATFLDLLEHLADALRGAPFLLVCLARPELVDVRPGWGGGKMNATSVLVEPLSGQECGDLIENLLGHSEIAGEVGTRIAEAAEGNPLFIEEMLSMLIDDGLLVRGDGRWVAARELAALPVPPTVQAVVAARLDLLGADERAVIARAAVEGKVFHDEAVAELAPEALRPYVGRHLDALVRKELIRPERPDFAGTHAFRFRHLLVRDAAYDAMPKSSRAALHEAFGRWLERRAGDRVASYEAIIGYHLEQAYRYRAELGGADDTTRGLAREAAGRLGTAASGAFVRRDAQAAVSLMSRAVALLPADDPTRVDLVPNVRVVQGWSGELVWAERVLTEAVEAAAATDDRALEAHALVQRGFLRLFTQPDVAPAELFAVADGAIGVFEATCDELGLARAWRLRAQAHYLDGHAGGTAEASDRALEHAGRAGDLLERREIVEWLSVALMLGPTPAAEASARCEVLLAEVRGDPILEPTVLSVLGNVEAMQGRMEHALELLARFRVAVRERGESIWLFAINFGFVVLADDPVAAENELRHGYEALGRMREKSHFSSVAALLARALYAQGRYEEADALTRESEAAARPNDIHSHLLWRSTRAKVLARRGDVEAGEALAREAVAFAAGTDFLDTHGDALMDLAEILRLAGRADEASAAVEQAVELYERKGNSVAAGKARTLPAS